MTWCDKLEKVKTEFCKFIEQRLASCGIRFFGWLFFQIWRTIKFFFIPLVFVSVFFFWVTYPNWIHNVFNNFSEVYCQYHDKIPSWIRAIIDFLPDTQSHLGSDIKSENQKFSNFGNDFGTFGDSFGALNTLFSGFAFAGIIISIVLQSKELKATREEVKGQKEEFEKQTAVFNKQTFENTFFQMLQQHNELIKSITAKNSDNKTVYGREALQHCYSLMKEIIDELNKGGIKHLNDIHLMRSRGTNIKLEKKPIHKIFEQSYSDESMDSYKNPIDIYRIFHNDHARQLRIYFMSIFQILKYVKDRENSKEIIDGKFYTNILRAQLLEGELFLLFFNCLSEELGAKKYKPLVEHYAFFEHLPLMKNVKPVLIAGIIKHNALSLYADQAFGENESIINSINAVKRNVENCP